MTAHGVGNVTQTYQTDAWGVPAAGQPTSGQPFRYTGEQFDPETGFVFLRARSYLPAVGRFTERDTLFGAMGKPTTQDRYLYAGNNPVLFTDPSGQCFGPLIELLPGCIGAVIGGATGAFGAVAEGANPAQVWTAAGVGAAAGFAAGQFGWSGPVAGAAIGATSEFVTQTITTGGQGPYNWGAVVGAGAGRAIGGALGGVAGGLAEEAELPEALSTLFDNVTGLGFNAAGAAIGARLEDYFLGVPGS